MQNLDEIRKKLVQQEKDLQKTIENLQAKQDHTIPGTLNITGDAKRKNYYCHCKDPHPHFEYLSKNENFDRICQLAQQDHERDLLKAAFGQQKAVREAISAISGKDLENVYSDLKPTRKELVKPMFPDRERFISDWKAVTWMPGKFEEGDPEFFSEKGERVRSKSEKIIADKYYHFGVPYRYEYPLILMAGGRKIAFRPDFYVLNTRTCKAYFHQHLGRMDDPKYVNDNLRKLEIFQENGIFLGEKLFLTYETLERPFNDRSMDVLIDKYLR